MLVLGIETSCDETSAAIVEGGTRLLSNIVASQDHVHAPFGGVVPELASRFHVEKIQPVVEMALAEAKTSLKDIEGIAVTSGPGLMGSLLVGQAFAKALSYAKKIPFYGVNHLKAHLHAIFLESAIPYPFVGLLVSGGHTELYDVKGIDDDRLLGQTLDDAAGEAFDKVAKLLGLGYPGGKHIDELSQKGNNKAIAFPRPYIKKGKEGSPTQLNFSFSGLKTAVLHYCRKCSPEKLNVADIAASFQEALLDTLLIQSLKALEQTGYRRLVIAGGVASNSRLRAVFKAMGEEKNVAIHIPSFKLCTDNAAMIAALGHHYLKAGSGDSLTSSTYATAPLFRS